MFTGIVQGKAKIVGIIKKDQFSTFTLRFPENLLPGLALGASVANNGCCLSVTGIDGNDVSFDLIDETLRLTNLGDLQVGDLVNIERAAKFNDEIGGHLMSGHIMTTAEICDVIRTENNREVWFEPKDVGQMKFILHKGYIGIDGISLTVCDVTESKFSVHLIPETLERTTLGTKREGQKVNIEIDPQTQAIVETVERVLAQRKAVVA